MIASSPVNRGLVTLGMLTSRLCLMSLTSDPSPVGLLLHSRRHGHHSLYRPRALSILTEQSSSPPLTSAVLHQLESSLSGPPASHLRKATLNPSRALFTYRVSDKKPARPHETAMASTDGSTSPPGSPVSFLRAIDGSHLKWADFRTMVLGAFRIVLIEGMKLSELSRPFSERLEPTLYNLSRFTDQEGEWRRQVRGGKGFGSMIFPPNVLPPIAASKGLHRCHAPRMSREALPPRAVKAQESLFELPAPRPGLLTGFATAAFDETELSMLPQCTASTGTIVDFTSGCVSPGTTVYCPFLVFERMNNTSSEGIEAARNQCAIAGAHCIRALQLLFRRCNSPRSTLDKLVSFSVMMENSAAVINYHFVDGEGRYCMAEIATFVLDTTDGFGEFQAWIEAIEDWGSSCLKPVIKNALRQHLRRNGTPPISPMPSLTLSIDTAPGHDDVLLKLLRSTFSTIKWKCDGEYETPLNSSVAHCGTPLGARRMRTMALSPHSTSPLDILSASTGPATPISRWRMRPDWGNMSPLSRRHPLSPLKLRSDAPDSPVRRPTLSPCTPPPEAPFSAKSPMLVLQRRVDLAMDEIQELRALVQTLHGKLRVKNSQLESEKETNQPLSSIPVDDNAQTPKFAEQDVWGALQKESADDMFVLYGSMIPPSLVYFLFFVLSVALGHDVWEVTCCIIYLQAVMKSRPLAWR
ncbi:hypothetical protein LTR47_000526 [Exophiala xenobiotica]|nr:hypothetical protein LTR47_000526 [Exophiala xenobiotica]KAK5255705.1 hypothetical protein LTS06_000161 [Exophiala xenobiotica]KAK5261900.1 hypothetical protein LTR40_001279 [Exophiala xenobiotica]KAK5302419.1 hypothetical protein LTR14_000668 [Exophiala xenobiotica]KAK5317765.1 hypothetical protein LTR93_008406 [Exophiala xenobiotica]